VQGIDSLGFTTGLHVAKPPLSLGLRQVLVMAGQGRGAFAAVAWAKSF
jgi:hypothetical protein